MCATSNTIDINSATAIVRNYFKKAIWGNEKFNDEELDAKINLMLDFSPLSAKQTPSHSYEIICQISEGVFSSKKEKYRVLVGNDGIILSVERIENE